MAMGCRTGERGGSGRTGCHAGEVALAEGDSLPVHGANDTGTHPSSQRRPPTSGGRLGVRRPPNGRRPPGPDCIGRWRMGDGDRMVQKEGPVLLRRDYFQLL